MDVVCTRNSEGKFFCTEFYVKFKIARFKGNNAPLQSFEQVSLENEDDVALLAEQSIKITDKVDVFCNGVRVDVLATMGSDLIMNWYDKETSSFSASPQIEGSDFLSVFNLQPNENVVLCRHRASAAAREFRIWLYNSSQKFFVMDIDGTITKSDVKGYAETVYRGIYTYIHTGLANFLNVLEKKHGFRVVYLTSRPMAHKIETFEFLRRAVQQEGQKGGTSSLSVAAEGGEGKDVSFPHGPLFCNKERIMKAVYREVIAKMGKEYKSGVLLSICRAYELATSAVVRCPFVLGVGNRESDAIAYSMAGIPPQNILLINPNSKLEVYKYAKMEEHQTKADRVSYRSQNGAISPSRKDTSALNTYIQDFQISTTVCMSSFADEEAAATAKRGDTCVQSASSAIVVVSNAQNNTDSDPRQSSVDEHPRAGPPAAASTEVLQLTLPLPPNCSTNKVLNKDGEEEEEEKEEAAACHTPFGGDTEDTDLYLRSLELSARVELEEGTLSSPPISAAAAAAAAIAPAFIIDDSKLIADQATKQEQAVSVFLDQYSFKFNTYADPNLMCYIDRIASHQQSHA